MVEGRGRGRYQRFNPTAGVSEPVFAVLILWFRPVTFILIDKVFDDRGDRSRSASRASQATRFVWAYSTGARRFVCVVGFPEGLSVFFRKREEENS